MSESFFGTEKVVTLEEEGELIRLAQERTSQGEFTPRSRAAFIQLYMHYLNDLSAFVLRVMRNTSEAADVVDRTIDKAWLALPKWEPDERSKAPFRGWLFKIAINEIRGYWRAERRILRFLGLDPAQAQKDVPSWLFGTKQPTEEDVDERECIQQALNSLTEQEQKMLLLSCEQGYTAKEIALLLGMEALTTEARATRKVYRVLDRAVTKFIEFYREECLS